MKCPHCNKHISYPTQKQLLAWVLRYFGQMTWKELTPIKKVAKRMGITEIAVLKLLQGLRRCWPNIAPKKESKKHIYVFNEETDSEPRLKF